MSAFVRRNPLLEALREAKNYLLHMPAQTETEAAIVSKSLAALAVYESLHPQGAQG